MTQQLLSKQIQLLSKQIEYFNAAEENYRQRIDDARCGLKHATYEYMRTGVAVANEGLHASFGILKEQGARAYFQELASTLKRPLVYASADRWSGWASGCKTSRDIVGLTLPANTRLNNIASGLSIAAKPIGIRYKLFEATGPLVSLETKQTRHFYFLDADGRKMFDDWIEGCATNTIYRIVLKI